MSEAIIIMTPAELRSLISEEVRAAVKSVTEKKLLNATELAAELGVSVPTLARMEEDGRIPRRVGRYWDRLELERWKRDRSMTHS